MALAEMIKRGPGRPPKTNVERAVDRPMGDGVPAAMEKVEKALAAFTLTRSTATNATGATYAPGAVEAAKANLNRAVARKSVAEQLGEDDAPTDEDIAALEAKVAEIEDAIANAGERRSAFDAEIERRREILNEAVEELAQSYKAWADNTLDACDEQIADAVYRLGEAIKVSEQVQRWSMTHTDAISVPKLTQEGRHRGPEKVELPQKVRKALDTWWRGYCAVMR